MGAIILGVADIKNYSSSVSLERPAQMRGSPRRGGEEFLSGAEMDEIKEPGILRA